MLRLYLDAAEGAAAIGCPACGRPLLLGAERMGRLLVGYRGGFSVRPGRRALLVCPGYECKHQEEVEIAGAPADAVPFSALHAAGRFMLEERFHELTLDEMKQELDRLVTLFRQAGSPKLVSAIRYWKERYQFAYWHVLDYLEQSHREGREVVCDGKARSERGTVVALLHDGVLLERSGSGDTILLRAGDLHSVAFCMQRGPEQRFDFGNRSAVAPGNRPIHTPDRFVVITGQELALDAVTRHGKCRVHTRDREAAGALGLRMAHGDMYAGEFPTLFVDRCFLRVRYCQVQGRRLHLQSETRDPDVLQLGTRDLETARALDMHRSLTWIGQRNALRWWRFFHRSEIEKVEEVRVPLRLPSPLIR